MQKIHLDSWAQPLTRVGRAEMNCPRESLLISLSLKIVYFHMNANNYFYHEKYFKLICY